MSNGRLLGGLIALAAAATLLAGCAAPTPAPTHSSATAKPTPKPTPTQAASPSSRVPVKCTDLFSNSAAGALIGTSVQFSIDESTLPKDIRAAAERQYGSLDCVWAGPDRPDGAYSEYLGVTIAPDAAAGFTANIAQIEKDQAPTLTNVAGSQSEVYCFTDGGLSCSSDMLVGDYWVDVELDAPTTKTVATGTAQMRGALTSVADHLVNTTAGPAWNPPGASLPTFCAESARTFSASAVDVAVGGKNFLYEDPEAAPDTAASYPLEENDYVACNWTTLTTGTFSGVGVSMLRGGAWVMPPLLADLGTDSLDRGPFRAVDVPGVGTAAVSCSGDANDCSAMVADGSVLINVSMDYASPAVFDSALVKLVKAIATS